MQAAVSGLETGLIETQDLRKGHQAVQQNWSTVDPLPSKQFDVEVVSDTVSERSSSIIVLIFQKPDPMLLPVYDEDGATF